MLIDVPTGFGKTSAAVLAWTWNRVLKHREDWPRRLVYCLPMRTLVEQTHQNVARWLDRLGLADEVAVHVLMGGETAGDWDIHPERNAVLVGTQDMLLSRALNRGYGMSRYRWPMHFGLLNNDCLWVMDEVQLMGPGLWTSAQLDWMRIDRFKSLRPCVTWWMSATIHQEFLNTLDRKNAGLPNPTPLGLSARDHEHGLLRARRPCRVWKAPTSRRARLKDSDAHFQQALADAIVDEHTPHSLSLVVCNTVERAQRTYAAVRDTYKGTDEVVLLTSRFRPQDRQGNQRKLLDFEAARKRTLHGEMLTVPGLICVSTQVIEAGVDVSARRLWSEVAPWPSIIQRLGRLNRDGVLNEDTRAYFWEGPERLSRGAQFIGPYEVDAVKLGTRLLRELATLYRGDENLSARDALARLSDQDQSADKIIRALTPPPEPCPRAIDVHGLFSTEPDIFGGFTDVSPFVRSQDQNPDVTVFWREWSQDSQLRAAEELFGPPYNRDEGCPVSVDRLRRFMELSVRGWVWDDKAEAWQSMRASEIRPGMLVMLRRSDGGYSDKDGWTGLNRDELADTPSPGEPYERFEDDRYTESGFWVTLEDHLRDAGDEATRIAEAVKLNPSFGPAVVRAASEHDIGKALHRWQRELPKPSPRGGEVWAKAPRQFAVTADAADAAEAVKTVLRRDGVRLGKAEAWGDMESSQGKTTYRWHIDREIGRERVDRIQSMHGILRAWNVPFRPGLRHEAASALALWHSYYRRGDRDFNALSIYLSAAHHGKVRTVLTTRTQTGDDVCGIERGSTLPWKNMSLDFECAVDGASGHFSKDGSEFIFEAPGWTGLVNDLLGGWESDSAQGVNDAVPDGEPRSLGPFALAYLETLVRCADERASKEPSVKKLIDS